MEYEENKADWGQAYDYSFAAHQSTTGQKQSKKFPSDPLASSFKAGRGKIIVHHFACKYTSKRLIMKFNPEQKKPPQKMHGSSLDWQNKTNPSRRKKLQLTWTKTPAH